MVPLLRYSRIGTVEPAGLPGINVYYPKRREGSRASMSTTQNEGGLPGIDVYYIKRRQGFQGIDFYYPKRREGFQGIDFYYPKRREGFQGIGVHFLKPRREGSRQRRFKIPENMIGLCIPGNYNFHTIPGIITLFLLSSRSSRFLVHCACRVLPQ
jgi:hypothetical protein